jgi:hypothetical protein
VELPLWYCQSKSEFDHSRIGRSRAKYAPWLSGEVVARSAVGGGGGFLFVGRGAGSSNFGGNPRVFLSRARFGSSRCIYDQQASWYNRW